MRHSVTPNAGQAITNVNGPCGGRSDIQKRVIHRAVAASAAASAQHEPPAGVAGADVRISQGAGAVAVGVLDAEQ